MNVKQIAASEYGHGEESVDAEQALWDNLPAMDVANVARIIKAVEPAWQYKLVVAALRGAAPERVSALRALFSADELRAMTSR